MMRNTITCDQWFADVFFTQEAAHGFTDVSVQGTLSLYLDQDQDPILRPTLPIRSQCYST